MTDPVDKRSLAIEAAEAIDPSLTKATAIDVMSAVDPTFKDRAIALIDEYQHGLDTGSPRTASELSELKALLLGA